MTMENLGPGLPGQRNTEGTKCSAKEEGRPAEPRIVKVGYQTYEVKLIDHEVVRGGDNCYADVDFHSQVIRISTLYPKDRQVASLIHETVHALDHLFNIGLEEEQVELLGTALAGLVKDNPRFLNTID